jgi:hypothetical protein
MGCKEDRMAEKGTPRRPVAQRQIGVSLSDEVRDRLESAAKDSGRSIAEEIRQRLERTFEDDLDAPETRKLLLEIQWLVDLIAVHTGYDWFSHPAAASVMRQAIDLRLARTPGGDGTAAFAPGERPVGEALLAEGSDDPRAISIALDQAINSNNWLIASNEFPDTVGDGRVFRKGYRAVMVRHQLSTHGAAIERQQPSAATKSVTKSMKERLQPPTERKEKKR